MTYKTTRRRWLLAAGTAAAGSSLRSADVRADRAAGSASLTAYQDGPQIWVRLDNRLLTSYRTHATQKYPYFFPLTGPASGLSLTSESALPWPHHRSLFFGCDRVNADNFWQGPVGEGQIVSQGLRLGKLDEPAVEILDSCHWRRPGQEPVLIDERRFVITAVSSDLWYLDATIQLQAMQPVHIEKTNHSLFAVRAAPELAPAGGGALVNSAGLRGEQATLGQPAAWCDFSGRRTVGGEQCVEGIALLDHPHNPWSPCKWFTRDYGFMSPTPLYWLDDAGLRLAAQQTLTLRYCIVAHRGDAATADLAGIHRDWVSTSPLD